MCAGELLGQAIDIVEVTVRLVLVLLFQLGIIEVFVIKLCCALAVGMDWKGRLDVLRIRDWVMSEVNISHRLWVRKTYPSPAQKSYPRQL